MRCTKHKMIGAKRTPAAAISVGDWGDERRRREDRGAEGVGCGEGVSPPQKKIRFLSSKRRHLVHSECYCCSLIG